MRHTNIRLTNRQISGLIALVVFLALGSFSAGYFWGEKKSAERFLQRIGQESFGDQVYSSICSLYESDNESEARSENGNENGVAELASTDNASSELSADENEKNEQEEITPDVVYYAQLVGFGTIVKAKQFVERLAKKGMTAHLRERKGKTARGKSMSWYQVVTEPYRDKDELIALVEKVKLEERLHDVRIVTV